MASILAKMGLDTKDFSQKLERVEGRTKKFADKLKSKVCNFTFVCELFHAFAQPSLTMPSLCVSRGADCGRYQNPEAHPEG